MRARHGSRRPGGFTLIELLAALLVGGIVLAALTSFYLQEQRALRQQQIQIETSQALRVALEQMVRDLRAAGRNPTDTPGIGLVTATATEIRFTLDADFDGVANANDPAESKGFRRNGTGIESWVPTGGLTSWQRLAGFMSPTGNVFAYYDAAGNPLASPVTGSSLDDVARVDITLTAVNRVPGAPAISRTESASVRLRNRG